MVVRLFDRLRRTWQAYERQLAAYPARTKALVSGCLFGMTDVLIQGWEQSRTVGKKQCRGGTWTVDVPRAATQAAFGVYYGIVHAHWIWSGYERAFAAMAGRGVTFTPFVGALSRVAFDQFILGTPLFNAVFFYSTGRFAQNMSHDAAVQNVHDRLLPMLALHWSFWVPFHTLNFWKVPFRHRLVSLARDLVWSVGV